MTYTTQAQVRAAIRLAGRYVSISGSKTSWTVYGPWKDDDVHGPSTAINADSYYHARDIAVLKKARIALALMGRLTDDMRTAVDWEHYQGCRNTAKLVAAALTGGDNR